MNANIILEYISILLPTITLYFIFKGRMDSNHFFLNWRIRKLEKEICCMKTILKLNLTTFSDEFNKKYEEFKKKLHEK